MKHERSPLWPKIREEHLENHPTCEACGGTAKINVHHVVPSHLRPDLELDESNLITLCESRSYGVECHRTFGHLGSYFSWNVDVRTDAPTWLNKFKNRPKSVKSRDAKT
jgi:hypothetical protein